MTNNQKRDGDGEGKPKNTGLWELSANIIYHRRD